MKIGLYDVDSHNWPNLCLMKLGAYHKARGDAVELWSPEGCYDLVYKSRVFTDSYSRDCMVIPNADHVICGGTGYGPSSAQAPYPSFPRKRENSLIAPHLLSPTKPLRWVLSGPPREPSKAGRVGKGGITKRCELWRFPALRRSEWSGVYSDALACPDHEALLLQLADSRAWVDFSQGLDIRLITPDNAALLNRVRTKAVHFAWDDPNVDLTPYFRRFLELTNIRDSRRRRVYVLTHYNSTHEQDLYRVEVLRGMGYDPYVMIYDRPSAPRITRQLQRWVNNKRIFYTVANFADYIPGRLRGEKGA